MQQTPCEYMMWNGLPVIRKEIAECMINTFGLNQKEAATKLDVTPAAISQYRSNKRGRIKIVDEEILLEITKSAERLIHSNNGSVVDETCRICKILMQKKAIDFTCLSCSSKE
ncbi:MAG: transcriptional regulator [Thermoplasmatota archaeon]